MADILDVLSEARAEDEASRARQNLAAPGPEPDELAQARRDNRAIGGDVAVSDPVVRRSAEVARANNALSASPRLRAWLANSASDAALARDDVHPLSFWEQLSNAVNFEGAFQQGQRQVRIGQLENRLNPQRARTYDDAGPLSPAERGSLIKLEAVPTREYGVVGQTVEQLPQMLGSFDAAGRRAVRDVRQSWRQVYGDEPRPLTVENTIAATVLAPIAGASATISGVGGAVRGMTGFTYEQEAGAAFREFRNLRDVNGNLIDENIAGAYARDVGLINAAIEFGGLGLAAKVSGVTEVAAYLARASVKSALRRRGMMEITRRVATGMAANAATEGMTELTQEGVTIALGNLAMDAQGGEWDRLSPDEIAERTWEAFRVGATVGAVFGAVPAGARFTTDVMAVTRARQQEEIFQAINDGAAASKLRERAPSRFAAIVNAMTTNGPINEVRIDAHRFAAFFQDQDIDPLAAADRLDGVGAEALRAALDSGGEVVIPMGTYASQITGTPAHAGLAPHVRMGPDQMTPAEVKARFELGVDLERATSEAVRLQGEAKAKTAQVDAVTERIATQFGGSGFIPQATRAYVKLYAEHIVTMAARAGVDPSVMLDRVGFTLHGPLEARNLMAGHRAAIMARVDNAAADIPRNPFPRDNFGVARPKAGLPVQAVAATDFGTIDGLDYAPGDMIVTGSDGSSWPVGKVIFEDTYAATGEADQYQKRTDRTVGHFTLSAPREIATREGVKQGAKGDVVLIGQHGEMWPVKADVFASRYEGAGDGAFDKETAIHPTALRFGSEAEIADLMQLVAMGADMETLLEHPVMARVGAHASALEQTVTAEQATDPHGLDEREYVIDGETVDFEEMLADALRVARAYAPEGVKKDRVATMVIGNFGAGKSTFIKKIAAATSSAVIDADQVKGYIPEYEDGYNTAATMRESGAIRNFVRDALVADGENLVIEHVGDIEASVVKSKAFLEAAGYDVTVVHIRVQADEAVRRQVSRFIGGGRPIEPESAYRVVGGDLVATTFDALIAKNALTSYIEVDATPPLNEAQALRSQAGDAQLEAIGPLLGGETGLGQRPDTAPGLDTRASGATGEGFAQGEVGEGAQPDAGSGVSGSAGAQPGGSVADPAVNSAHPGFAFFQGPKGSAVFTRDPATGMMTSALMKLFESRDLSTPIHEFGHIFLETLRLVANSEGASAQVQKDWQTALDWMGVTAEGWAEMSMLPLQQATDAMRPYHEKFARGFEAYVLEGKAPSMALRDVFSQFKRWLGTLYKTALALNVTLTPEIRQVFDRMLATDAAITEAEAAQGGDIVLPREVFAGKGKANDAAYARYLKHRERARTEASEAIDKEAIGVLMSERTRQYRARERQVRKTVEIDFDERPEERAFNWLAFQLWAHGAPPQGLEPMRLSPAALAAEYPAEVIEALPAGLVTPDVAGLAEQVKLVRAALREYAPKRMIEVIADLGGIMPFESEAAGDVRAIIGTDKAVPVRGRMKRKLIDEANGRPLDGNDGIIQALWEMGYFGTAPGSVFQLMGPNAANADIELLSIAVELERQGKSTWGLTGWARSPLHGGWQFEADPDGLKLRGKRSLPALARINHQTTLGELIDFPKLFEGYPELEHINVDFYGNERGVGGGSYRHDDVPSKRWIFINHADSAHMLSTLRHEIAHAIARIEGWPAGYSPDAVRTSSLRFQALVRENLDKQAYWRDRIRGNPEPTAEDIRRAEDGARYEIYMLEKGEVEARIVQNRGAPAGVIFDDPAAARRVMAPGDSLSEKYLAQTWRAPLRGFFQESASDAPLIAVHNLTGANLLHALKLGGIPAPSLAIVRADIGFTDKFGEITLIAAPSLIDPRTGDRARTFNADIYSARYPTVHHKVSEREWNKAIKRPEIQDASRDLGFMISTELDDSSLTNKGIEAVIESTVIQLAWLRSQGENVDIPQRDGHRGDVQRRVPDYYAVRSALRDRKIASDPGFRAWVEEGFSAAFIGERLFKGWSNDGERRLYAPHDLANVVKMLTKKLRDGEGFNYGVGSVRSTVARQFRSLAGIKKARGNIVDSETMDAVKKEIDQEFWNLADEMKPNLGHDPGFGWGDVFCEHLKEVAETGRMSSIFEYYRTPLSHEQQEHIAHFLEKLRDLPTEYFETKMKRAVGISEFAAAVVPDDADVRVITALENAGVPVHFYPHGDKAARVRAVQSADPGALFQGERPTINEFLDLLRRDLGGKDPVYSVDDQDVVERRAQAEQMRDWFAERGVDIDAKAADLKAQIERMAMNESTDGVDADTAASIFGFDTGLDLLEALANRENRAEAIAAETKRRMLLEMGDPFADGSVAEEARLAAHSSAREHTIELELDALSRATGGAVNPVNRAAKRIAEGQIDRMTVKQVRGHEWFLGNERRQAKAALENVRRGNMHEAQMAKYRQLVNFHLYKLARVAADEMDAAQRYFRKFDRAGVRANIDKEYLDQIDALLDQYELRKLSGRETQRRLALAAWVKQMEDRGLGHLVNVDPAIVENARRMPFSSLQIDDARGLRDTIRNIEHLGRLKEKLLDAADKRKFEDVVSELVATMDATGPISKAVTANYSPPAAERAQKTLRVAHAEMTRMEFLFRYLDGGFNGPLWRTLWLPFARAADKESLLMHEAARRMREIWDRYTPSERTRMFKTRVPMTDLPVGAATNYTKAELISIALNLGNAGNVRALVDGFGWGQTQKLRSVDIDYDAAREQMIASLSRVLDARDWETVQQVWDLIGGFRDEAFQLQEDMTGVRPEAVEASPLTTPYGQLAGGYYPLKFDRTRDRRVAQAEAKQDVQEMWGSNWSAPMTRKGHTINRVGSGGRPVKLSLTVFSEHVQNVAHDIAYRRAIVDVDRIITNNAFADKFTEVAGEPMYDQLRPWLQAIASDKVDPSATMWKFLQKMRGNVAIGAMGLKLSTALQQLTGLLQAVPMLGAPEMAGALVKLVRNPATIAAKAEFIRNRSEFMRTRMETLDRDIRETLERMDRDDKLYPIRHNAFALVGMFDWATSSVVWTAAYDKARSGKVDGIDPGSDADAVAFADSAVRTTQSAGLNQDLPAIMRGPQVNKLLTMFFSYFSVLYNWTAYDQVMGTRKGRIPPHVFIANMALIYVISPLIAEALAGRWTPREDEDDDERNARLMGVLARMPFQTVPVINGIANAVGSGFEYQLSPAQSGIGQTTKALNDLVEGRTFESEDTTKRGVVAIGYLFGLPTPAAWIPIDYVADKLEGEEEGFDLYEALVADRR